jgi:hypothetical protein
LVAYRTFPKLDSSSNIESRRKYLDTLCCMGSLLGEFGAWLLLRSISVNISHRRATSPAKTLPCDLCLSPDDAVGEEGGGDGSNALADVVLFFFEEVPMRSKPPACALGCQRRSSFLILLLLPSGYFFVWVAVFSFSAVFQVVALSNSLVPQMLVMLPSLTV